MLAGIATPAFAQSAAAPPVAQAPALAPPAAPQMQSIRAITVSGAQRLEPGTVLSYTKLRVGSPYNRESLDLALKDLFATERSEEHTSELQSLMRISYAVFCLKTKNHNTNITKHKTT